jgi:hypothetical protein
MASQSLGSTNVPAGHQNVATKVYVYDSTLKEQLIAVYASSGQTVSLNITPLTFSGSVSYSFWQMRAVPNDPSTTYAWLSIWGPDSNGQYYVLIGRGSTDAFQVATPNTSILWNQGSNQGFAYDLFKP